MAASAFFDKTYDDALALLVEARNYIAYQESVDLQALPPQARLLVSQETMRVTCRLTESMAWLLAQRAVQVGELSNEDVKANFAIGGQRVCLDDRWTDDPQLPAAVRGLLSRTLSLYERIGRLDDMLRQSAA
ncbi:MAG: DUF1465 family protein [Alphaproteobacteria bacterium]